MAEKEEIRKKESVLFLYDRLRKIFEGKRNLEIKYEYREEGNTHAVEISSLKRLKGPWIALMYEFNEKFTHERIIFILKNNPPSLRVKEPLFVFRSEFSFVEKIKFAFVPEFNIPILGNMQVTSGIDEVYDSKYQRKWQPLHEANITPEENYKYCFN